MSMRTAAHNIVGCAFLAFTAATVYPRPVRAAAAPCVEQATYEYLECLIEAPDLWSGTLCDLEFLVSYALCLQKDPA